MADQFELAGRVWPVLVRAAQKRRTLTYGEVAPLIGLGLPIPVRHALHPIYLLCPEKGWPHLTGLVVNADTGRPGPGFEAWKDEDLEKRWAEVFDYDWGQLPPPFLPGTLSQFAGSLTSEEDFAVPDILVKANGRGSYQEALRRRLLKVYGHRCALCDTRLRELLIASHIVPWAQDPRNRCNPRNAILLCRSHDALFDSGRVRILHDLSVEVPPYESAEVGLAVHRLLESGTSSELRVHIRRWRPSAEFLVWRLENLKRG
jgi:HNH endonuclease